MSLFALRLASRSLRRTPAFSISAVLTLVIGIGAVVSIFAVINSVLLRPLSFGDPERLVGAWHALPGVSIDKGQQTAGTYFTYQRHAKTIENIGLSQEGSVNVAAPGGDGEPQRVTSGFITATLVPTLQVPPLLGRNFTDAEDLPDGPRVVLISEQMWRNRFGGDRTVVGRMLEVNGVSREIVGVMPASFRYPTAQTRLWLPLQLDPGATFGGGFNYNGIARLAPDVTLEQARADFAAVLPRMVEIYPELVPGVTTQMLLDQAKPSPILIPLREDLTASISRTLWLVGAAAGLVLLVACANVANLILVRADSRHRELAVREALGAGRARVLSFFVFEAAVVAGVSGLLGVGVAAIVVRMLSVMGPANIPRLSELRIDVPAVGFALIVTVMVGAIITLLPALRVGRMPLSGALREGGRSGMVGKAQHRLRGAMVALQIALSLVALAGSGLLIRTFQRLNAVQPGFEADHVATFWLSLPRARYANDSSLVTFWSTLTARVSALPGVQSVGLTTHLPLHLTGMNQNPFYAEDDPTSAQKIPPLQIYANTDAGYFKTLGIPVLAGRTFDELGRQRGDEAVISQRTAEQFWKDPTGQAAIGKRFRYLPSGPWNTVIGVVGSVRDTALAAPATQSVYMPIAAVRDSITGQSQRTLALVVRTSGDPATLRQPVEVLIRELDPTLPTFDVQPMSNLVRESIAQLSFMIIMLGAAAVVTLLLGAIGLYGVMAYVVTLRMRELGVRVALGASPRSVVQMMIRQGLALTLSGVAAGLVLFAVVARFLRTFLYGVAPGDPVTLAVASTFLVMIAILASWLPARRASLVDPARVLRSD